jgi:hypothetical protein
LLEAAILGWIKLGKMKTSDHALAVVKAAMNLVPFVGGAVASLISDYVPSATQRSIDRGMVLLGEQLKSLDDRIDPDAVNKDEFAELFKSCYLIIIRTHHDEKLRAASALLSNLLLKPGDPAKVSYEELDHLVRCLDAVSIGAIMFIGAVRRLTRFPQSNNRIDFGNVSAQFPMMDASLLMSLATELDALNLIHIIEPAIRVAEYGNYGIELTPIVARFVDRFLEGNQ